MVGLQIKDGKQKVALAYIVMGPIVVVMALGQAGAGIMVRVGVMVVDNREGWVGVGVW